MKRFLPVLAIGLLLLGAAAGQAQVRKIKVAISPITSYLPVFAAQELGYFKEMGLEVETIRISGGPKKLEAMAGGSVDIAGSSIPPMIRGVERGLDFTIVSAMSNTRLKPPGVSAVVVRRDAGINSPKDLAGKKVAIAARGQVDDLTTNELVRKDGGDPKKIIWLEMRRSVMLPALLANKVEGAYLVEPFLGRARGESSLKLLMYTVVEVTPGGVLTGFAATKKWLKKNSEVAARYSLAIRKAVNWINTHEAEARMLLPKYTRLSPKLAKKVTLNFYAEHIDIDSVQRLADLMHNYGYLEKRVSATDMVYYTAR